jgi:hypothetical protein
VAHNTIEVEPFATSIELEPFVQAASKLAAELAPEQIVGLVGLAAVRHIFSLVLIKAPGILAVI